MTVKKLLEAFPFPRWYKILTFLTLGVGVIGSVAYRLVPIPVFEGGYIVLLIGTVLLMAGVLLWSKPTNK